MADDLELAGRIYVGLAVERDAEHLDLSGKLAFGDVVRFVSGDSHSLTPQQTRQLFSSQALIRGVRQMLSGISASEMPRVAAASTGDVSRRRFEGGVITITNSRGSFVRLFIELDEGFRAEALDIVVMSADGGAEKLSLQSAPDEDGKIVELVDTATERGRRVAELLRDPLSTGWIAPRS